MNALYGHKDREHLWRNIFRRELTVAVLNGRPLTVTDIVTDDWYNYDAKYKTGFKACYPANIPKDIFELCLSYAVKAHQSLGCRGVTRSDFRWNEKKERKVIYTRIKYSTWNDQNFPCT